MDGQDRIEQKKFDNAIPPHKVLCKECSSEAKIIFKDLHNIYEENSRVLFNSNLIGYYLYF